MKAIDDIDREILSLVQEDDRIGLAAIGKRVGLAASSVNERLKRLTRDGVISGFHARLAPNALGFDLLAFVFVGWSDPATEPKFLDAVARTPAIQECHHVTGAWNYLLKVRVATTRELERLLAEVLKNVPGVQRTETLIALSSTKETAALPVRD